MVRRTRTLLACMLMIAGLWLANAQRADAQTTNLDRYYYYPYHLFPHNYWPQVLPQWPERPGEHYEVPPPYMAYPPFHEPHWRHDLSERKSYYRGFHFWLDAF